MNSNKAILLAGVAAMSLLAVTATRAGDNADGSDGTKKHHKENAVTKPTQNSQENYKYDRMAWDHSVPAWSYADLKANRPPSLCLPSDTVVIGQAAGFTAVANQDDDDSSSDDQTPDSPDQEAPAAPGNPPADHLGGGAGSQRDGQDNKAPKARKKSDAQDGGQESDTKTQGQFLEVKVNPNHFLWGLFGMKRDEAQKYLSDHADQQVCEGISSPATLPTDSSIYVKPDNAQRWGWEYGALVVPFKMQLGGKHSFTGSASVGAYLGYSFPLWDTGLSVSPVAFAGASNISVPINNGKRDTSQTMAGLSYGLGLITRVKDGFQVGLVFGKDHVDSAQRYQYNDKTWISFEIGYSFAQ